MGIDDRWSRMARRPTTRTISVSNPDGEAITRQIEEGGAYDPGLPLSIPAGRNTRNYRRTVARKLGSSPGKLAPAPVVTSQKGPVTTGTGRGRTAPDPRAVPVVPRRKPPVTLAGPGANQGRAGPAPVTVGQDRTGGSQVLAAYNSIKKANSVRYCEAPNCTNVIPDDASILRVTCGDRCRQAKSRLERRQKRKS